MKKEEDFIKALRESPLYKKALASARDDAERNRVSMLVEGFVSNFAGVLAPLIAASENDPEFAKSLRGSLVGVKPVVTGSGG